MPKREYTWFIKPLDGSTNNAISQHLPEQNFNHKINVWECPYCLVRFFWRSRKTSNLRFEIYNKEGTHGKIRRCNFLFFKPRRKKKTAK